MDYDQEYDRIDTVASTLFYLATSDAIDDSLRSILAMQAEILIKALSEIKKPN